MFYLVIQDQHMPLSPVSWSICFGFPSHHFAFMCRLLLLLLSSTIQFIITTGHFTCCVFFVFFTVPLLSRVCPSDVCRIWKSGASLRVDATLLGFENMTWIRGQRSYIFRGDGACFCQRRPKSYQSPPHNLYQFWLKKVGSLTLCLK